MSNRVEMAERLRTIIDHYQPKALNGDREAAWILLRAMELQAKLYGV